MFWRFCLLSLWLLLANNAAADTFFAAEQCQEYPLNDYHQEEQGIYTGERVPDMMLLFEVNEKSVPIRYTSLESNETIFGREKLIVRDTCPIMETALYPNLTELLKQKDDECIHVPAPHKFNINSARSKKMYMAVWTFTVPENQCFMLEFLAVKLGDHDVFKLLDGELSQTVHMELRRRWPYTRPRQNETTTVSVVYLYRSPNQEVYWRMRPSLNCYTC